MTENTTTAATPAAEEGQTPCFVRHPDAGSQCREPASVRVYGIGFCERHGEEARIGALMEELQDAAYFFERFRSPHIPTLKGLIERELAAAVGRLTGSGPTDEDYQRALLRAYSPNIPKRVREQTRDWKLCERPGHASVADTPLDSLVTLHKLLCIAHEEQESCGW